MKIQKIVITGIVGISLCFAAITPAFASKQPSDREVTDTFKNFLTSSTSLPFSDIEILAKNQVGPESAMTWKYRVESEIQFPKKLYVFIHPQQVFNASEKLPLKPEELKYAIPMPFQVPVRTKTVSGTVFLQYNNGSWQSQTEFDDPEAATIFGALTADPSISEVPVVGTPDFQKYTDSQTAIFNTKKAELDKIIRKYQAIKAQTDMDKEHIYRYHGLKFINEHFAKGYADKPEKLKREYLKLHTAEMTMHSERCKLDKTLAADVQQQSGSSPESTNAAFQVEIQKLADNVENRKKELQSRREQSAQYNDAEEVAKIDATLQSVDNTAQTITLEIQKKYGLSGDTQNAASNECLEGPALESAIAAATEKSVETVTALDTASQKALFLKDDQRVKDIYKALGDRRALMMEEAFAIEKEARKLKAEVENLETTLKLFADAQAALVEQAK